MLNSSALAAAFAGAVAISWHMPVIGFLIGGLAWTVVAGVTGYLIGWLYNRVNGQPG